MRGSLRRRFNFFPQFHRFPNSANPLNRKYNGGQTENLFLFKTFGGCGGSGTSVQPQPDTPQRQHGLPCSILVFRSLTPQKRPKMQGPEENFPSLEPRPRPVSRVRTGASMTALD